MSAPLISTPAAATYATITPYLTPEEYQQAPTAVDASNLTQGGSTAQNNGQLMSVIRRASGIADRIVFGGSGGTLAATIDTDGPKPALVQRGGIIKFGTQFRPVLYVTALSVGFYASQLTAYTAAMALNAFVDQTGVVNIPTSGLTPYIGAGWGARFSTGSKPLVQMTYVNGYPVTTLSVAASLAATSITPKSVVGIMPGMPLSIYDNGDPTNPTGANEDVVVASSYVVGAASVPLVSPLASAHSAGVPLSNLPDDVKQAVIMIVSALIKSRGSLAIVRGKLERSPTKVKKATDDTDGLLEGAMNLLQPFQRSWLT